MANRIALELIADANPLMKGLEQAQRSLGRFTDAASDAGHAIGGSLGNAIDNFMNVSKGGAAAAGVLAGGMAAAAASAIALTASAGDQIDQLDRLSQKTGIAIGTLQSWSVMMAENGIQADGLAMAMKTLATKMYEAGDPASDAAKIFKSLGLNIKELGTTENVIQALSEKFKELPDGPEKARISSELFSKSWQDMLILLNKGPEAFDQSKAAAKGFGAVLSDLQNNALLNVDTALDHVGVAANALKLNLAAVFAPSVEWAARMFADALGVMSRFAKDVDTALDTLAIRLTHIGLAAQELGKVLFSKDIVNTDAWKQAFDNIGLIDKEAAKLIAKRRELADVVSADKGSTVAMSAEQKVGKVAKQAKAPPDWHEEQNQHIVEYLANRRAEMALGSVLVQITQREVREREKINDELDKYFETESNLRGVNEQEQMGLQIVQQSQEAWKHRNDELEMAVDRAKVVDEAQQALFHSEFALIGASDIARQKRMDLIEAEGALQKQVIEDTIFDEKKKAAEILNLELQMETKRRQAIQQFPSFFEQQMQAVVQSNSFSIGQITTSWTSGLANAAVNGGNFVEQAWKSTQVAVLQGLLNFGVQKAAALALQASQELAVESTLAASKIGLQTATNATIIGGTAATASATTGIWAGAAAGITGTFATLTGAITGFFTATLIPFFISIGTALMTFLSSIAAAASATIFGIPYGVAILAGVALIGAAIGSLAAFAFADGGIVTGPTMGMIGEAGSNEAVIPLNKRGASFMRDALGGSAGGGPTTVVVELDGRQIARSMFDHLPSVMRIKGVSA